MGFNLGFKGLKCSEVQKLNTEFQIQALSLSLGES